MCASKTQRVLLPSLEILSRPLHLGCIRPAPISSEDARWSRGSTPRRAENSLTSTLGLSRGVFQGRQWGWSWRDAICQQQLCLQLLRGPRCNGFESRLTPLLQMHVFFQLLHRLQSTGQKSYCAAQKFRGAPAKTAAKPSQELLILYGYVNRSK